MPKAEYEYNSIVTYKDEAWIGHDKWIAWPDWRMNLAGTGPTEAAAVEDMLAILAGAS